MLLPIPFKSFLKKVLKSQKLLPAENTVFGAIFLFLFLLKKEAAGQSPEKYIINHYIIFFIFFQ